MRSLRLLGVLASASSILAAAASFAGCAKADGTVTFGPEAGSDASVMSPADATTPTVDATVPDTSFPQPDTGGAFDAFVPPPDVSPVETSVPETSTGGLDAGFDGGLLFFGAPGTSCTTLGSVQAQACGRCGMQTSTCVVRPDGGLPSDAAASDAGDAAGADVGVKDAAGSDAAASDAAAPDAGTVDASASDTGAGDAAKDAGPDLVWGEFGSCTGEIDGGCLPGTTTTVSCGLCGTQSQICQNDCTIGTTNCVGQVANGCSPGTVEFTIQPSCTTGSSVGGYEQTCSSTCTLQSSTTCVAAPTTLTAPAGIGGKVNTFVDFVTTQESPLLTLMSCPTTFVSPSTSTPSAFVTVTNPSTTQSVTVSVWASQVTGQPVIDTAITAYSAQPLAGNLAALKSCLTGSLVTDSCMDTSDPTSCLSTYGGLMIGDFNAPTIPAGGSIAIFLQDQLADVGDLGIVQVNVRTESFQ